MQMHMFDLMRAEPVKLPVDPDGPVVEDTAQIHTVLRLDHPKLAFASAQIELHPHGDKWMWATSYHLDGSNGSGGGYRVGEKWGHFAASIGDATYWAVQELRHRMKDKPPSKCRRAILKWLDEVEPS